MVLGNQYDCTYHSEWRRDGICVGTGLKNTVQLLLKKSIK